MHQLVMKFIQKTAGILLYHQQDNEPRTLIIKTENDIEYTAKKLEPITPNCKIDVCCTTCAVAKFIFTDLVSPLTSLLAGEASQTEKYQNLLWISGLNLDIDDFQLIPNVFTVSVIVCLHLVENNSMYMAEAECLIQSIVDVHQDRVDMESYPRSVKTRAFQLGFLYKKTFVIFNSCLAAVGLKCFQVSYLDL